jgi:hypothetical protein
MASPELTVGQEVQLRPPPMDPDEGRIFVSDRLITRAQPLLL